MTIITTLMTVAAATMGAPPAVPAGDPARFQDLSEGRNATVIATTDIDEALKDDDPAVLINLGIAFAREGQDANARSMFEAAKGSANRCDLETATGAWVDSRRLARIALGKLVRGEFRSAI